MTPEDGQLIRVDKLLAYLDSLAENTIISAGDLMGYLRGYMGDDVNPEDEIEARLVDPNFFSRTAQKDKK